MFVLYILMRTDMASMNPGKAIAQGSHATSQFTRYMENTISMQMAKNGAKPSDEAADYLDWMGNLDFGTVLTLGCTEQQMRDAVQKATRAGIPAGIVTDPTYPLRDGGTTHFFSVDTCGWLFADKQEATWIVGDLSLHP